MGLGLLGNRPLRRWLGCALRLRSGLGRGLRRDGDAVLDGDAAALLDTLEFCAFG